MYPSAVYNIENHPEFQDARDQAAIFKAAEVKEEAPEISNAEGGGVVGAVGGAVASIVGSLGGLGIGSKSRLKEAAANEANQNKLITAQSKADTKKSTTKIVMISLGATFLLVAIVLFFTLRK